MKKLITIILALIMTLFATPNQGADQPSVTAVETPQTAITTQVEQVPKKSVKTAETAFVSEAEEAGAESETEETTVSEKEATQMEAEVSTVETAVNQETPTEECTEITKKQSSQNRLKKLSNASTKAIKALRNTNRRSVVNQIHSRMTHQPRSMIDR